VDAAHGYEYEPLRQRVEIAPGQGALTLRLKRMANMNAERYFSGDTHVHFLSTQGSHTEAAGEDLNVVNLLLSQWGHLYTNTEEFTGRPSVSPDGRTIVYASQENRQHILGHLSLLGLKQPVMPWCTDGPGEAELGGGLDITMSDWADACHAQGGTVVLPHLPTPNGEPAVLIATGRADAVEMLEHLEYETLEYYRYLNGGYRLPLVGGTDRMDGAVPVGLYRTYAYVPPDEEFNYDNWCKGLRSGRTFLSGGPLLWFTVEGQPIGSTLKVKPGATVEVEALARSVLPIHTLQIVQQGRVVADTSAEAGARELRLHAHLKIEADTWLAARCGGPRFTPFRHYDQRKRGVMAHTSPIYLACGDTYGVFDPATADYMLTLIEGGLSYIRTISPQRPAALTAQHHGEADHLAHLERPFLEAQSALHRRLHETGVAH
jgi:WD40-like Beta Propeller Repeat